MHKIISESKEAKRKSKNQLIIGLILIGIMLLSVIGYSFQREEKNSGEKINYNEFEFVKQGDYWVVNIDGNDFTFKYNPEETEDDVESE